MGPPGSSPKVLKRRLDDTSGSLAGTKKIPDAVLAQRKLYDYPKNPPSDTLLIPIRLDVDAEGYRYIDSFSWNVHEKDYTYETFAATLVRDLNLPESFRKRIASQIEAQVEKGKRSMPWHESVTSESLHPICINIRINDTILIDRFEGLSGEFEAQVALAIREQLRDYSRLIKEGLRDRVTRLPPVTIALRDRTDVSSWEPSVKYILAEDIALLEREDFKRMRAHSQSSIVVAPPPAPVVKPNRPPKPVNTFLMFCREWRKKIMTDNVNTSAKDASKILGEMWQKLSDQERAKSNMIRMMCFYINVDDCRYIPMTEKENERRLKEWQLKESLAAAGATPAATAAATGAVAAVALGTGLATTASVALSTPTPLATTIAANTATILVPNGAVAPSAVHVDTSISTSAVPTPDDIALDEDEEEQEEEEEEEEEEEQEEEEIDDDVGEDIDTDGDIPIDVDMILDGVDLHLDL
ncbi:Swi/snf-related matrix-associated actin-dependent regulator of chromatin, partial [Globisporangium splendens]